MALDFVQKVTHGGTVLWFRPLVADRLAAVMSAAVVSHGGRMSSDRDAVCSSLRVKRMCSRRRLEEVMTYAMFRSGDRPFAEEIYTEVVRIKAA